MIQLKNIQFKNTTWHNNSQHNNKESTISIMTFSIMTFSIMTFSIMTFSIMTFSIMAFSIMTTNRVIKLSIHKLSHVASTNLAKANMRKRLKEEETLFSVDFFLLLSCIQLRLVDSGGSQSRQAHSISDKDDHVLGKVGVDVPVCLERFQNLVTANLIPVFVVWIIV